MGFFVGLIIGACMGFLLSALFASNKDDEDDMY